MFPIPNFWGKNLDQIPNVWHQDVKPIDWWNASWVLWWFRGSASASFYNWLFLSSSAIIMMKFSPELGSHFPLLFKPPAGSSGLSATMWGRSVTIPSAASSSLRIRLALWNRGKTPVRRTMILSPLSSLARIWLGFWTRKKRFWLGSQSHSKTICSQVEISQIIKWNIKIWLSSGDNEATISNTIDINQTLDSAAVGNILEISILGIAENRELI